MNFKQATDQLLTGITLEDLAGTLGVSVQSVRQARAVEGSTAYRSPPNGWEKAVVVLANRKTKALEKLITRVSK